MLFFFRKKSLKNGYTLIELLVSIAIFLLIIGAAITAFVSIVRYQRKILYYQEVLNEISYVQEYISKALRMAKTAFEDEAINCFGDIEFEGYSYLLTRLDPETQVFRGIKFINASDNDACYEIFLDNSNPESPVLKQLKNSSNETDALPLVSKNLKIKFIKFGLNGTDGTFSNSPHAMGVIGGQEPVAGTHYEDNAQARVTLLIGIEMPDDNIVKIFQTTVSQRNINVVGK